jgi:hypothetical protein
MAIIPLLKAKKQTQSKPIASLRLEARSSNSEIRKYEKQSQSPPKGVEQGPGV